MKNRKLLLIVSLVLALTMSLGGTLAYLTDTDADVNVMTLGNVKIVQNEQQRVEANGEFTSELEPFKQGKMLLPVTYPGDRTTDTVTIGDYTIELSDKEANYVDKIISVTNTGNSDAYIRTLVAVPTGGTDWVENGKPVDANSAWLHWNNPAGYSDHWKLKSDNVPFIEVDGKGYYVWEFVHNDAVAKDETTFPMVRGFYLDNDVNADDNGYYITYPEGHTPATRVGITKRIDDFKFGETIDILVLSQAVQADGFADAQTALDTAFGTVSAKAATWFTGYDKWEANGEIGSPGDKWPNNDVPSDNWNVVETPEDLPNNPEGDILFGDDIEDNADGGSGYGKAGVVVDNGITLDGNGKTYTVSGANSTWDCAIAAKWGTIKNLTVSGAMRGIFMPGATGDVYIDNVIFDDVVYTFNSDAGSKEYGVYISNSTLNGWTSFSDVHKEVIFTNCTFGEGLGYAYCRPYQDVTFIGCDFAEGYKLDLDDGSVTSKSIKATLTNCTYNGVALTTENVVDMLADGEDEIPNLIIN